MLYTEKIERDGKTALMMWGYSDESCIDLIKIIENMNNREEAKIICDEKSFIYLFNSNKKFDKRKVYKLGIHDIIVNDKTIDRYKKYFDIGDSIVLICSSEFGTVGIIRM
jgi:hypothetical protein